MSAFTPTAAQKRPSLQVRLAPGKAVRPSRRYLLDSSRASNQIQGNRPVRFVLPTRGRRLFLTGAVEASMRLITPITGGACVRYDLRKPDGLARGRPGGPRLAHLQRPR